MLSKKQTRSLRGQVHIYALAFSLFFNELAIYSYLALLNII